MRVRVFLHQIPLVHHEHNALMVPRAQSENVKILGIKSLRSIRHHNADVRVFDGTDGAHHGIKLQTLLHFALLAQTGGVDQVKVETETPVAGENGIAGRAGQRGDDMAVLAEKCVDNGGLAHIRLTHDGDTRQIIGQFVHIFRKMLHHLVEKVARAAS